MLSPNKTFWVLRNKNISCIYIWIQRTLFLSYPNTKQITYTFSCEICLHTSLCFEKMIALKNIHLNADMLFLHIMHLIFLSICPNFKHFWLKKMWRCLFLQFSSTSYVFLRLFSIQSDLLKHLKYTTAVDTCIEYWGFLPACCIRNSVCEHAILKIL